LVAKERLPGAQGVENFMYLGDDGDVRKRRPVHVGGKWTTSRRVSPVGTRALSDSYRNRFAALATRSPPSTTSDRSFNPRLSHAPSSEARSTGYKVIFPSSLFFHKVSVLTLPTPRPQFDGKFGGWRKLQCQRRLHRGLSTWAKGNSWSNLGN